MRRVALPLASLTCLALTVSAQAQISFLDLFQSATYTQNSNNSPGSLNGYFVDMRLYYTSPGDFTTGSVTGPGPGTPVTLGPDSPTNLVFASGLYPSLAAMNSDFPTGAYTYTGDGGAQGMASATLDYTADAYPSAQPYLTGSDYSTLQGVNAASPITAHFSPFAGDPSVNDQFQFFTIFDPASNTFVYDAGFLPQSATSVTIAANTLQAGHNYIYELIDSNRVLTTGTGGQFAPQLGFDLRTSGAFFTAAAVPEPGSIALFASMGAVGAGFLRRRKQARKAV